MYIHGWETYVRVRVFVRVRVRLVYACVRPHVLVRTTAACKGMLVLPLSSNLRFCSKHARNLRAWSMYCGSLLNTFKARLLFVAPHNTSILQWCASQPPNVS